MTNAELLIWFKSNYPVLVQQMRECEHDFNNNHQNPFHLENDVWSHTLLVLKQAEKYPLHIRIAALLHDIGKIHTREEVIETNRVRFFSHEAVSAYASIDILTKLEQHLGYSLPKELIFKLIALHQEAYRAKSLEELRYQIGQQLFYDLLDLAEADQNGRFTKDENKPLIVKTFGEPEYEAPEAKTNRKVTIMVGTCYSGKSTYVSQNAKSNDIIVSRDAIIESLEGDNYNDKWKKADQSAVDKAFSEAIKEAIKAKEGDIWIDTTAMSKKSRRKLLNAFNNDFVKECVVMLVGENEMLNRQAKRTEKRIDFSVIDGMIRRFYPPMKSEGFHEVKYIFN